MYPTLVTQCTRAPELTCVPLFVTHSVVRVVQARAVIVKEEVFVDDGPPMRSRPSFLTLELKKSGAVRSLPNLRLTIYLPTKVRAAVWQPVAGRPLLIVLFVSACGLCASVALTL
jgi:hypothetical protein